MHKYFDRKSAKWNIQDFLEQCDVEPFERKIDVYTKDLEAIANYGQGKRRERAQLLLDRYREGTRPDRQQAKAWQEKCGLAKENDTSIHFHQPVFTGSALGIGSISGGAFSAGETIVSKKEDKTDRKGSSSDLLKRDIKQDDDLVSAEVKKNIVNENELESELQEPHVVHIDENISQGVDWDAVMQKVETYRNQLKKGRRVCDPLYYYLIDHSGLHGPTSNLLADFLPQIQLELPKEIRFCAPKLCKTEAEFFDLLVTAEDVDGTRATTVEEKTLRKLVSRILDSVTMQRKNNLSETEHQARNIIPLLDATIGTDRLYWVKYGEQSLEATAERRNKGRDPNDRARIGYKVDAIIEYQDLNWNPVVSCVEVAGGLPRCTRSKEWDDTLKLGLELRDLWALAKDHLAGVNASDVVWWGLTVVGRKIRIYALAAVGGLFHLVLTHEAPLPSSKEDLGNVELVYLALKGYKEKLDMTKKVLCELSRKRARLIARGKRSDPEKSPVQEPVKKPKIVHTPDQG